MFLIYSNGIFFFFFQAKMDDSFICWRFKKERKWFWIHERRHQSRWPVHRFTEWGSCVNMTVRGWWRVCLMLLVTGCWPTLSLVFLQKINYDVNLIMGFTNIVIFFLMFILEKHMPNFSIHLQFEFHGDIYGRKTKCDHVSMKGSFLNT